MTPTATSFPQSYKINGPFAPVTDVLQAMLQEVPRAAAELYHWLRRQGRPFTLIEINLKDFAETYNYGLPWIKKCYQDLIEHGLWQEDRKWYGGREYRGILIDPGLTAITANQSNLQNQTEKKAGSSENLNFAASNPYPAVPITEDLKDLKRTKTLHPPVLRKDNEDRAISQTTKSSDQAGEKLINLTYKMEDKIFLDPNLKVSFANDPIPETQIPSLTAPAINFEELNPHLPVKDCPAAVAQALAAKAAEELDVRITRPIFKLVMESTIGVVVNAIAAVKQRLESKTATKPVKSKEGFFTAALQHGFKPNQTPQKLQEVQGRGIAPVGFSAWYDAAYAKRLVCGSTMKDGEMWLYRASDAKLVRWQDLMAEYPDLLAPQVPQEQQYQQIPQQCQQKPILQPQKQLEMPKPKVQTYSRQAVKRPQMLDLSDVIAEISLLIKRLGWQEPELRSHLQQNYGKRSRQLLDDNELFHFADWLKQQVAQVEQVFSQWTNEGDEPMSAM